MTLRDRIEAAPDKLAAARVALEEAAAGTERYACRFGTANDRIRHFCYECGTWASDRPSQVLRARAKAIRALRDSLGGDG